MHIQAKEYDDMVFILEKVLRLKIVESYERYRTTFANASVEIALDEYPFGVALEIEGQKDEQNPREAIQQIVKTLNLDTSDAYRLSWDDKYSELCQEQGVEQYKHVTFDKPMPKLKNGDNKSKN